MKYLALPSGRILDMDGVIFVSEIKDCAMGYQFTVVWMNKHYEHMTYGNIDICEEEYLIIKRHLMNSDIICD